MLCSTASREAGEAIHGTALDQMIHWIAVEDRGTRPPRVTMKGDLAPGVLEWFVAMKGRPHTRPVLIRRKGRRRGCTVFYARTDVGHLRRFDLDRQADLLDLDWQRLLSEPVSATTAPGPLLVCTHGSRDACCGRLAPAVQAALSDVAPERVWQSTHLGGHRFAPTLVALPSGVQYGRVHAGSAAALVRALDDRRLHDLDQVRGRTSLSSPAQAAALWLRRETGMLGLDDIVVDDIIGEGDRWRVHLHAGAVAHDLQVRRVEEGVSLPGSCGGKPKPVRRWQVQRVAP